MKMQEIKRRLDNRAHLSVVTEAGVITGGVLWVEYGNFATGFVTLTARQTTTAISYIQKHPHAVDCQMYKGDTGDSIDIWGIESSYGDTFTHNTNVVQHFVPNDYPA